MRACAECEEYFRKSLFVFGEFGGNDYNAPLFSGKTMAEVKTYVPLVVDSITRGIEVHHIYIYI